MAAAKKTAAKKTAATTKRPPRSLWIVRHALGALLSTRTTRAEADDDARPGDTVHGPYVLAERVREV